MHVTAKVMLNHIIAESAYFIGIAQTIFFNINGNTWRVKKWSLVEETLTKFHFL